MKKNRRILNKITSSSTKPKFKIPKKISVSTYESANSKYMFTNRSMYVPQTKLWITDSPNPPSPEQKIMISKEYELSPPVRIFVFKLLQRL